jgi:hypothetical protein
MSLCAPIPHAKPAPAAKPRLGAPKAGPCAEGGSLPHGAGEAGDRSGSGSGSGSSGAGKEVLLADSRN